VADRRLPLSVQDDEGVAWRTLDEVFSSPRPPAQATRPERVRAKLVAALQQLDVVARDAYAQEAIERLRNMANGEAPARNPPGGLAEDAALLRCLIEQPDASRELLAMRAYLASASPGRDDADLATDHAFTLEQLSFLTLLEQPHQLDRLRATFEMFRSAYIFAYVTQHSAYWEEAARLRTELDSFAATAQAVKRLNTLRALGPAVGIEALAAYRSLTSLPSVCDARDLQAKLLERSACPQCGCSLDDQPPSADVERTLAGLRAALAAQQTRLAGEAVRRIIDRGGERLQQFLQIAQAADVAALTNVLDDELLSFLQELLVAPEPSSDRLREIARAMPVVDEAQIDAALATLRGLLLEQLAEQRAAS
jgi:hypothetical protein